MAQMSGPRVDDSYPIPSHPTELPQRDSDRRSSDSDRSSRYASWLMVGLRYVLPAAIVLGGAIVMVFGSETDLEGGAGIVSAGLAVWGMNWLYRASIEGDRVREAEEAARDYLDAHGHWPDEDVPLAPTSSRRASATVAASDAGRSGANRPDEAPARPGKTPASPGKAPASSHDVRPHTSGPSSRRPRG